MSPVPEWTAEGIIPAFDYLEPAGFNNRAPYKSDLLELIERFGTSIERCEILRGFLKFREKLHTMGLQKGFQWVNGSFVEDVETIRQRSPSDIDVISFHQYPDQSTVDGWTKHDLQTFNATYTKRTYKVDAYFENLDSASSYLVSRSTYWFGLFTHQKNTFAWKGCLQISLEPRNDSDAVELLTDIEKGMQ